MPAFFYLIFLVTITEALSSSFKKPQIEYGNWIAMIDGNPNAKDIREVNKQPYQATANYGGPPASPEDCYIQTGCSSW